MSRTRKRDRSGTDPLEGLGVLAPHVLREYALLGHEVEDLCFHSERSIRGADLRADPCLQTKQAL